MAKASVIQLPTYGARHVPYVGTITLEQFPGWRSALAQTSAATLYNTINAAAAASPITVHALRGGVSMLEGSGAISVYSAAGTVSCWPTAESLSRSRTSRRRWADRAADLSATRPRSEE